MTTHQLVMAPVLDVVYAGKWIAIVRCQPLPGRKTDNYEVMARDPWHPLGVIRWYGPWRKYAFMPYPETVWEPQCLRDISKFLDRRTRLQRQGGQPKTLMEVL